MGKAFKILILTTERCEGCNIAVENAKTAISMSSKNIELEVKTRTEVGIRYLKYHDIRDFPTIMFFINGREKYRTVGVKHPLMILRWIDIHFDEHSL